MLKNEAQRYAFYLDASCCSGCKACQVACKDKNALPMGLLWRRIYEIAGGGWERRQAAWSSSVYAYHLSMACNHCRLPICAEVCPSAAFTRRADGLVLLDGSKCLGCRYCSWACPYGAPQYDEAAGRMTKCDFCADQIDAGRLPACVAACPMRALDFGTLEDLEARHGSARRLHPMPESGLTDPSLVLTPHPAATLAAAEQAHIANREEVSRS
jgi:anaerobic dimethyl sulfoxide reductase subunit B (iron-sulfur subunit)